MNFRKQARDKKNQLLEAGDILQVNGTVIAVVRKVVRQGRETLPYLLVSTIVESWPNTEIKTSRSTYDAEMYRRCYRLEPPMLRNDVPKFSKALAIRNEVLEASKR